MTARKTATKTKTESWDAFWAEVSSGHTEMIRGVEVTVPTDLPLGMIERINELKDSEAEEDLAELIATLFGVDALGQWRANGMGTREFKVVFAWGFAHAGGSDMSYREAYDLVMQEEAGKAPSPPNRATRRATASSRASASSGGRSKRTSSGSTTSARKTSRS